MTSKIALSVVLAAALLTAAGAASGSPQHAKLQLRSTSLGRVLVDARGHTLYLFGADHGRKSSCYGQCAVYWPPFLSRSTPVAGTGLKKGLLSTAKRKDGTLQVVYGGHPLYFFKLDTGAGQTKGEGMDFFGGRWYALGAAGTKMVPTSAADSSSSSSSGAPAGSTTTTPASGGGYGGYPPH